MLESDFTWRLRFVHASQGKRRVPQIIALTASTILLAICPSCFNPLSDMNFTIGVPTMAGLSGSLVELFRNRQAIMLIAARSSYLSESEILALPGKSFTIDSDFDCEEVVPRHTAPRYCLTGFAVLGEPSSPVKILFDDIAVERDCAEVCSAIKRARPDVSHCYDAIEPITVYFSSYPDAQKNLIRLDLIAYPKDRNQAGIEVLCASASRIEANDVP